MIDGVKISYLKQIPDERGKVMHMLRCDDEAFEGFGEIYFSCISPGAVKSWHMHKEATLNYAVPHGHIKLVLYDDRDGSTTKGEIQEMFLGPDNYLLVTMPPLIWYGFKGIGDEMAIVANCTSIPYDPKESNRLDPFDPSIPYGWGIKHG